MAHDEDDLSCDCVICQGVTPVEFYADIRAKIKEFGQNIILVMREDGSATEFSYTIGRHERGLPELLLLGNVIPGEACIVLNRVAELDKDGLPKILTIPGSRLPNGEEGKVKLVQVKEDLKGEYTIQVPRYYRINPKTYNVLQVIIGDDENHFPGDPLCKEPWASTLILAETLN